MTELTVDVISIYVVTSYYISLIRQRKTIISSSRNLIETNTWNQKNSVSDYKKYVLFSDHILFVVHLIWSRYWRETSHVHQQKQQKIDDAFFLIWYAFHDLISTSMILSINGKWINSMIRFQNHFLSLKSSIWLSIHFLIMSQNLIYIYKLTNRILLLQKKY